MFFLTGEKFPVRQPAGELMRSPDPLATMGGYFYGWGEIEGEGGGEGPTTKRVGRKERGDRKGGERIPPPLK